MCLMPSYDACLAAKRIVDPDTGMAGPVDLPADLFPHQADIVRWALRRGRAAIFAGLEHRPEDPANLLRVAIGFEKRAVDFFSKHVEECPEGSVERELYEELAAEEREHVELLTLELERFHAGQGGIL